MADKNIQSKIKAAMIAAVSEAFKYKEKNPKSKDEDAISHIVTNSDAILKRMDL